MNQRKNKKAVVELLMKFIREERRPTRINARGVTGMWNIWFGNLLHWTDEKVDKGAEIIQIISDFCH